MYEYQFDAVIERKGGRESGLKKFDKFLGTGKVE